MPGARAPGASDGTKRLVRGPVRRPALGTWCPRAHSAPSSPMTMCRSGILRRRSALKLAVPRLSAEVWGSAPGGRQPPKILTNRSTADCTRYRRLRAARLSSFDAQLSGRTRRRWPRVVPRGAVEGRSEPNPGLVGATCRLQLAGPVPDRAAGLADRLCCAQSSSCRRGRSVELSLWPPVAVRPSPSMSRGFTVLCRHTISIPPIDRAIPGQVGNLRPVRGSHGHPCVALRPLCSAAPACPLLCCRRHGGSWARKPGAEAASGQGRRDAWFTDPPDRSTRS